MSNKRKNSNYNYKNREQIAKEKENIKKENNKSNKLYWASTLLLWLDLIVVVVLAILNYEGTIHNAEKIYVPLTGIAMFLLSYKNKKFNKTMKIIVVCLGIVEILFGLYLIFFK